MDSVVSKLEKLIDIGIALSSESSPVQLLKRILESAQAITFADGGTLYSVSDKTVKIEILRNESLGMSYGGNPVTQNYLPTIPLFNKNGTPNISNVVTYSVHTNSTVNIENSYDTEKFDFSGTRTFDGKMGYRSVSFLTVPLRNHENVIIGVLQLINAADPVTKKTIPFDYLNQRLIEALASQAAIALTKEQLIVGMKNLFESMIKLIADAIDKKSPYTGGHCRRVPEITMMLAEAAHLESDGVFSKFHLSEDDRYELEIASWLHDCGKIVTPEHVVDKATKLQTIFDRIELVKIKLEVAKRDEEISYLKKQLQTLTSNQIEVVANQKKETAEFQSYQEAVKTIENELEFLKKCNTGSEFMTLEDQERVKNIAKREIFLEKNCEQILTSNEVYNLLISRGTLNPEEREIINNHIIYTNDLLKSLPFPRQLKRVPEYAGGHHERMDGKGYPNGLTKEQLSIQARIIGVADVFEALTAKDRPYKPGKMLSESLKIMAKMSRDGHLDSDLFNLFLRSRTYLKYAEKFVDPSQIDEVNIEELISYNKAS